MAKKYTHLHFHTEYSILDGANKIKNVAKEVKKLGMDAVAMTDHGNMFGAIDFYQTMKREGLKPIIGMEAYIHNHTQLKVHKDIKDSDRKSFHVCLYAKDEVGYKNLMYLSSMAYINGFYRKPRISKKLLQERSEGLVCTSACLAGEVNFHLNQSDKNIKRGAKGYEKAKEVALQYKEMFGEDFYLELMRHGIDHQENIDADLIRLSRETGVKIVATNDTHYTYKDDSEAHEVFMCIGTGKTWDDPKRLRHSVHEFYIKSPEEMEKLFFDIPEAIDTTNEIADKCNLELKLGDPTPPNFKFTLEYSEEAKLELPEVGERFSFTNDSVLFAHQCWEGLEERLQVVPEEKHEEYRKRLQHEIDIIDNMKFPGYMLIVWDFVRASGEMDIPVGPGRGSAAGSLVAFALKITDIDPMKYDLLFERFLNPERVSMPDIDMDFAQNRRKDIIHYVQNKYGKDNVAQVITFNSMLAKGVVRDVARVFDIPYAEANNFAKLIPNELGITLKKAFDMEPKIGDLVNSDPRFERLWKLSTALEGLKRNTGVHAAGLVISNDALWNKTPIYVSNKDEDRNFVTQYSLNYLEDVDLIKFDFLGLKTLDVIYGAVKLIEEHKGRKIDWHTEDMDDPKVYDYMSTGKTVGMFQIESSGMQDLNKRLKPSNFEDVIALIALYRPGPMDAGMLDDFVNRKHGKQDIAYPFKGTEFPEQLREILDPTYGVIVYQEQVMQIVQKIGGFSLGKSDIVRRAMGKKKFDLIKAYKAEFVDGAKEQGLDGNIASDLYDLIEKFAGYGFNKSHSAAYAMITFQTAFLKTYYPAEFMASLLSTENDNMNKIALYVNEAKSMGIGILAPDIQESVREFSVVKRGKKEFILFGLGGVKGVGSTAIDSILRARKNGGKFQDINDFLNRVEGQKVNKKILESLIKAGAFDNLKTSSGNLYNRKTLLHGIDTLLEYSGDVGQIKKSAEGGLFGDDDEFAKNEKPLNLRPRENFSLKEILKLEKEVMNFYISGHPLDEYKEIIQSKKNLSKISDMDKFKNWQEVVFIALLEIVEEKISKKSGKKYAQAKIIDFTGEFAITMFSNVLDKFLALPQDIQSGAIGIKASIKMEDEDRRDLFIKEFFPIDEVDEMSRDLKKGRKFVPKKEVDEEFTETVIEDDFYNNREYIFTLNRLLQKGELELLYQMANGTFRGGHPLVLHIFHEGKGYKIETGLSVNSTFGDDFLRTLEISG
jgi:DNA polymerase-3 subunit alpha